MHIYTPGDIAAYSMIHLYDKGRIPHDNVNDVLQVKHTTLTPPGG